MYQPRRPGLKSVPFHTSLSALEGWVFTSLGFQPQAEAGSGRPRPRPRLGLKPQAIQHPPLQGGPPIDPGRPCYTALPMTDWSPVDLLPALWVVAVGASLAW